MDAWTYYDAREIPVRVELDTNGDDKPDVFEYYEGRDASRLELVRKEEDATHNGEIDITSYYKKGKLVRKEVSNPDLLL